MLTLKLKGQRCRSSQSKKSFQYDFELSTEHQGITAFYGRSGEGKSTLLRLIAGLEKTENGVLHFHSREGERHIWQDEGVFIAPEKRNIAYVFQEGRLFEALSVEANILYGLGQRWWRKIGGPIYLMKRNVGCKVFVKT